MKQLNLVAMMAVGVVLVVQYPLNHGILSKISRWDMLTIALSCVGFFIFGFWFRQVLVEEGIG